MATTIKRISMILAVVIAVIYIGLWIFPVHMMYDFKSIEGTIYKPGTVSIVEIRKKIVLLPGPHALWAVKTPDGYNVYRNFSTFKQSERGRTLSFPIDNFVNKLIASSKLSSGTPDTSEAFKISEKLLVQFEKFDNKNRSFIRLVVSPDRRKVLYSQKIDGKICVVTDGKQGKLYKRINGMSIEYSPDSKRVAYTVRDVQKWFYVVDGIEQKHYDAVNYFLTVFSPDSQRTAYIAKSGDNLFAVIDGNEEGPYDNAFTPYFSPNSKRVAYSVIKRNRAFMVIDGIEGKRYDFVSSPIFSPNSQRLAYYAKTGNQYSIVIDGIDDGGQYDRILRSPVFSPDGERVAYVVQKDNMYYPIIDGVEGKKYNYQSTENYTSTGATEDIIFSPDSKRIAFKIEEAGKEFMVVDGLEGKKYDYIFNMPVFSPDSKRLAFKAKLGNNFFVVTNGIEGKKFKNYIHGFPSKNIYPPQGMRWNVFSPDSKRLTYAVVGKKKVEVILNGKSIGQHFKIPGAVVFSPDSKHVAYIALDDDKNYVVLKDVGKMEYEVAGLAGSGIAFDSNNSFHFVALKNNGVYLVEVNVEG